jgi:hypothetical protein
MTPGQSSAENDSLADPLAVQLAAGKTVRDAARTAGVSESTAYRRLREASFRDAVAELRACLVSATVGRLVEGMTEAADVLRALLASESERVRLTAADRLLTHGIRIGELEELQRRVVELEARVNGRGTDPEEIKARLKARGIDVDAIEARPGGLNAPG